MHSVKYWAMVNFATQGCIKFRNLSKTQLDEIFLRYCDDKYYTNIEYGEE